MCLCGMLSIPGTLFATTAHQIAPWCSHMHSLLLVATKLADGNVDIELNALPLCVKLGATSNSAYIQPRSVAVTAGLVSAHLPTRAQTRT